jgi:hypothetical protein
LAEDRIENYPVFWPAKENSRPVCEKTLCKIEDLPYNYKVALLPNYWLEKSYTVGARKIPR